MGVMIPSDSSGHKHFHFGTPWIFVLDGDQFLSSGEIKRWQERTTVIGSRRHVGQGPDESKEPFKQKSRMLGVGRKIEIISPFQLPKPSVRLGAATELSYPAA